MLYDIMIIGGGPAGLTASLYAGRAGHTTALFEKMFVGGQAVTTYEIENYPGVPAVSGPELVQKMEQQTKLFGVETIHEEVISLSLEGKVKTVTTTNGQYQGKTVILTTGARPKILDVPGEQEFWGRGVSVCATCDGAFYKGKVAAVVGGGNTAIENAIFLSKFCKEVYLIHRRDALRGEKSLVSRLESLPNVSFIWDTVVEKILGDKVVTGVGLRQVKTEETSILPVDGVFVSIGVQPNSGLAQDVLETDDYGYLVTDENMRTRIAGVYAAGDARRTPLRQIITAAADGAVAAYSASIYLAEEENTQR